MLTFPRHPRIQATSTTGTLMSSWKSRIPQTHGSDGGGVIWHPPFEWVSKNAVGCHFCHAYKLLCLSFRPSLYNGHRFAACKGHFTARREKKGVERSLTLTFKDVHPVNVRKNRYFDNLTYSVRTVSKKISSLPACNVDDLEMLCLDLDTFSPISVRQESSEFVSGLVTWLRAMTNDVTRNSSSGNSVAMIRGYNECRLSGGESMCDVIGNCDDVIKTRVGRSVTWLV